MCRKLVKLVEPPILGLSDFLGTSPIVRLRKFPLDLVMKIKSTEIFSSAFRNMLHVQPLPIRSGHWVVGVCQLLDCMGYVN